ncbi:MAG: glutamate synthase large subunit [Chloroflexota bacterium]
MVSPASSLYDAAYEHGSCGLGFVARVDGRDSHEIVEQGLEILCNLAHRGASGSDPYTGDGAGILLQVPHAFLNHECRSLGIDLPGPGGYAVGSVFFLPDDAQCRACERALENIAAEEGQPVLGWRDVPVDPGRIGAVARGVAPRIRQVFLRRTVRDDLGFERKLYRIRRRLHQAVDERFGNPESCYVVSLSANTLVYKGLLQGPQVPEFYPDLKDPLMASALALVHSRFSTNTLGSWQLAHPYRYVAHNGEINTLRGNVNWMRARERELSDGLRERGMDGLGAIVQPGVSDTAAFDNALEFLVLSGRSLPEAMTMMIPEAWENDDLMDPDRRAYYQYSSWLMEPWDGPAAIAFTDGKIVGATLDRNGLRPARYSITRDGRLILASEEGALTVPPEDIVARSRLQPGRLLLVDTVAGRVMEDEEAKNLVISRRPYRQWAESGAIAVDQLTPASQPLARTGGSASLLDQQRAFGYTLEDLTLLLGPMAAKGKEPDGSMGTDTPLAVLSQRPQLLFSYFQQLFAQVTNPPIDPLRESLVMSLGISLGPGLSLLDEHPEQFKTIMLDHPILSEDALLKLRALRTAPFSTATLSMLFPVAAGVDGMERAVQQLCEQACEAVENGTSILILSDRGVDAEHAAIPSLLATAAVHHYLVDQRVRTRVGLVVETGEAREIHHFALLVGYGAAAVHPYLAFESIAALQQAGEIQDVDREHAEENYIAALRLGLLKVISKMGISTLLSYCGAQVFEAVGLDRSLIDSYFTGTASRIGGIAIDGVAREVLARHHLAFAPVAGSAQEPDIGGDYQLRAQGEYHQWNPTSIVSLQRAVRTGDFATFKEYTDHFNNESARLATLRGLFELKRNPIPLDEVEPAREIVKRFATGAMSFGSISREAHETLAIAMNQIGGKSNTGEGGEEAERFLPDANGDQRRSAIKQVASARFGVTTEYLVNADMLQIKMAQGSKPGEGGQLPGHKVSADIARVRHSMPGVGLISPPPHHDIYSIEDLAQLIYDLKNINPSAAVSVKLVAEVGVGTIAAGVAKAKADHITISGHDGGTGASPLSSIKHAGLPWELGLAETQQVLVRNGLRGRVVVQTDGHLKTGRDVVIAALLGAEEFAFSTAPLVATGCIMMRVCHLNTCPVGIATQDPELRSRFAGKPEHVVNYFFFLADEVRQLMAELGSRRFDDMVGRTDRLQTREALDHWKACGLDLSAVLCAPSSESNGAIHRLEDQNHDLEGATDNDLIRQCGNALEFGMPVTLQRPIHNTERTVGGMLSGEIARRYGSHGLPDDTIHIDFTGTAGQSFGAWGAPGVTLTLKGVANDGCGKGLAGARLIVHPSDQAGYTAERSVAVGNVALYGATSGEAYIRGMAGERFAVRNSGAFAVVEGVGDHGCEYMTGGTVVVLGSTGRNFAAGMSGGTAFVLDRWGRFERTCNTDMVGLERVTSHEDMVLLHRLIEQHRHWTGSTVAERILAHWAEYLPRFIKVMPHDLRRALAARDAGELKARVV